jgi:hypothetical protein
MLTREQVIEQINELPERFSLDELMERLLFIYKLETALEQSKKGQVTSQEELKEKYKKWLQ